ncbi:MAG: amino acid aminotransferase [Pirellulales bacterium]
MFESLPLAPPDSILGLAEVFQKDARTDKVNLTVGVYKDETGQTPILATVKKAETRLLEEEKSKGYLAIEGLADFNRSVVELVLGESIDPKCVAIAQSPGGTGALRVGAEMFGSHFQGRTAWVSQPTWPNHPAIFEASGLKVQNYPYLDAAKTGMDLDALLSTLRAKAQPGDLVCLHACCHNPTGIDPTAEGWQAISDVMAEKKLVPMIDFAYQGFGDGLEEDTIGVKTLLAKNPEAILSVSFSKNFGLYSERVGASIVVTQSEAAAQAALSQLRQTVRCTYSNPPRHGGAIVGVILNDSLLRQEWMDEVREMRQRISTMRNQFVVGMKETGVQRDFAFLLNQKGMFSYTGLNPMQADWLKNQKGIYIVGTGRINVAGLTTRNMSHVCNAIAECIESTI